MNPAAPLACSAESAIKDAVARHLDISHNIWQIREKRMIKIK
jgi:hypothetical protein